MSKLYYYHSVMNSGKSAHIIMQAHNLLQQGYDAMIFKPKLDTRNYGVIKSRALDNQLEAILIDDDFDIFSFVKKANPDYVFVDEVNFLSSNHVEALAAVADELDISVFGYGLLSDFKGELFEGSKRMVELANTIRELKSPCVHCGNKATMHLRKLNGSYVFEGASIEVGDTDTYESVCRSCYMKAKKNS